HIAKKQWGEIDRGKDADSSDERQKTAECEIPVCQGVQIYGRTRESQASCDEQNAADTGDISAGSDGLIVEPVPARSFLEHVFYPPKTDGQRSVARVMAVLERPQIRLVDVDQKRTQQRDRYSRRQIDIKQPVPIQRIGDPSADDRAERGRFLEGCADH